MRADIGRMFANVCPEMTFGNINAVLFRISSQISIIITR